MQARKVSDAITVPAVAMQAEMPPEIRQKTVVIPNPIDLLQQLGTEVSRAPRSTRILAVGRFVPHKNHAELVEAFGQIVGQFPEWTLRIVGDGELRAKLEQKIAELNLEGRVQLPGMTKDMPSEYAASSFVVMPSLYESFGLVTAEALASRRAVLGFAECVGTAELIEDDVNGILLPSDGNRVEQLAGGMARLIADAALRERLGANGPQSVRKFAVCEVVDKWEALLSRVACGQGPSIGEKAGSTVR
jgi:glycosyltransferase involved in cell wall biosynthesis